MFRSSMKTFLRGQLLASRSFHYNSGQNLTQNSLLQKSIQVSRGKLTSSLSTLSDKNTDATSDRRVPFQPAGRSAATEQSLDRTLHRLDVEIRRTGRINRREIEEVLQDIRELNSLTSSQSLMIIRCCGELVPEETFENRTKLVQDVWKTMENLKVPMDISHYNALLRVYLENEHKFNPTEFLQELGNKGLEPNRVTYQRLIARFCQDGDIDGASTILQHMKEKQLPINVHVFNALILGHAQSGDMESAEGIVGVMKQAGLEPNDDTFATLMRCYAMKADIESIKRIVEDCKQKDIFLVDRDFLEVIFTLAAARRSDLVPEIIPFLQRNAGFNQEATNVILRLVNIGEEDTAYLLLKEMPRPMRNEELAPSGNFFIRQLVVSTTPPDKIIKYCQDMISSGLNKHALLRACEFALQLKHFDKAFEFLEALHQSGFPIRQHYFWPFFASGKSEKDIYDGLKCMNYLEMSPTVETLRDYIIPGLLNNTKSSDSFDFVMEKLATYTKIPLGTIIPAALQYILQKGQMSTATKYATKYRVKFNHPGIRRALVDSYLKTRDASSLVKIVGSCSAEGLDAAREAVGLVLMELLESLRGSNKLPYLLPILKELLNHGLGISNSALEWIQNNLGEEITPEVSNLMLQLVSGDLTPRLSGQNQNQRTGVVPYDERTTEELESLLKGSVQSGETRNRGIKKALFIQYCREIQLEKAEAMLEDLKKDNFVMTTGLYALLLDLYCQADQLDKARVVYKELAARDISFTMDDLKVLRYALLLVSHERADECMEFLKTTSRDETRTPKGALQVALVWKILNVPAEKGDVDQVKQLFNVLKERNLTPINNVVLGARVKAYLVKDDLEGALNEFESCVNEFGETPWKKELFNRFIKAEDADRLQRVMDLSTKLHGEVNSLYDLVFAFLECGKVRQAKKILETPGLRARNEKLEMTCQKYLEDDKVAELEQLVDITREIFNVDRNALYFYLLKAYCKHGQSDKALSVWTSLQEENVQASPDLLVYLADFLRKNNLPVPFVEPQEKTRASEPSAQSKSTTAKSTAVKKEETQSHRNLREFRQRIEGGDVDAALALKQKIQAQGVSLNIQDQSLLIQKMLRAERLGEATRLTEEMLQVGLYPHIRILRNLTQQLGVAGNLEALIRLDGQLSEDLKRSTMFSNRICAAHVNSGKGVDYFNNYIKADVEAVVAGTKSVEDSVIPISAATYVLRKHEDLLPQFEELATKLADKGDIKLKNALWSYYMIKKDFGTAKDILDKHLTGKDSHRIMFRSVANESRVQKDEELVKAMAAQVLPIESLRPTSKAVVVGCLVDVFCLNEKPEEALEVLKEYLVSTVKLEDVHPKSLNTLKEKLEAKSIDFPYEIPERRQRQQRRSKAEESSDSDSDSSDSEKEK